MKFFLCCAPLSVWRYVSFGFKNIWSLQPRRGHRWFKQSNSTDSNCHHLLQQVCKHKLRITNTLSCQFSGRLLTLCLTCSLVIAQIQWDIWWLVWRQKASTSSCPLSPRLSFCRSIPPSLLRLEIHCVLS